LIALVSVRCAQADDKVVQGVRAGLAVRAARANVTGPERIEVNLPREVPDNVDRRVGGIVSDIVGGGRRMRVARLDGKLRVPLDDAGR
jgi:hypothetical protein